MGQWQSFATKIELKCGGCGSELRTSFHLIEERKQIIEQFNAAHMVCRTVAVEKNPA